MNTYEIPHPKEQDSRAHERLFEMASDEDVQWEKED